MKQHQYAIAMEWVGNDGVGTKNYKSYRRDYTLQSSEKMTIEGSSDPAFRGDPKRYNPEELLVGSLSSCHMLWYLHLCSTKKITVVEYVDSSSGTVEETADGAGQFVNVRLSPKVTISPDSDPAVAAALHHDAHKMCYIARSINFPVEIQPEIIVAAAADPANAASIG